jgi:peptide deformylase
MIITNESLLRVKCSDVLPDEIDSLRSKLQYALNWSEKNGLPGVGLAAPQIGIAKKMAIIRIDDKLVIDLVNAKIEDKKYPFIFEGEGCLSFPGRFEKTNRYREIVVGNNFVWPYRFIATEFLAVVILHELDHLNGVLLSDVAIK